MEIIVSDIENPFFPEVIRASSSRAPRWANRTRFSRRPITIRAERAKRGAHDYFGEKRILDVGNDDAHRAALPRGQVARMHVGKISEPLDRREHQAVRAAGLLAGLVQNVGDRGGWILPRPWQHREWLGP